MNFGDIIGQLFSDPVTNAALQGVVILGLLDFALGIIRAFSGKQFDLSLVDVWVRTQLAGRIIPIVVILMVGTVGGNITFGDISLNVITGAGLAAATAYAAVTIQSIISSLNPASTDVQPTVNEDTPV